MDEPIAENKPEFKLYNSKSILLATFIGGPIAAGILVFRNYINKGNKPYAFAALIVGFALLGVAFIIPDSVVDKMPNSLIPLIYTGIIALIIESTQGAFLREHKEIKGLFFSGWRAAGIGLINLAAILVVIFGVIFFLQSNFNAEKYNQKTEQIIQNEQHALLVYDMLETSSEREVVAFIQKQGIPDWQKNIRIIDELDTMRNIPDELAEQNRLIRAYTEFRIQEFELMDSAITDTSANYMFQINTVRFKLDSIIAILNQP